LRKWNADIKMPALQPGYGAPQGENMFGWFGKKKGSASILNDVGGMRLEEAEVDIMFIVKDNTVTYINSVSGHLFSTDDDGDESLNGRVVNFVFKGKSGVVEVFVAFDEQDAYTMFTMMQGMQARLDFVAGAIFQRFAQNNIGNTFSFTDQYATQYQYTYKLFHKSSRYFMVNNAQTQAFLIDRNGIQRDDVDRIKQNFWN
jgi:hypothetical protein